MLCYLYRYNMNENVVWKSMLVEQERYNNVHFTRTLRYMNEIGYL